MVAGSIGWRHQSPNMSWTPFVDMKQFEVIRIQEGSVQIGSNIKNGVLNPGIEIVVVFCHRVGACMPVL